MRKFLFTLLALALLIPLAAPVASAASSEADPFVTALIAGQNIDVGNVLVWDDGAYLYVKFQTQDDWVLTVTQLDVASSVADIPQNQAGNPVPGHFNYSSEYDKANGVTADTYRIPLPGANVVIAAHAGVSLRTSGQTEGAWGDGSGFSGNNWAMYFWYHAPSFGNPVG